MKTFFSAKKILILIVVVILFYVVLSNISKNKLNKSELEERVEAMLTGPRIEYDATRIIVKYKKNSQSQISLQAENKNNFLKQASIEPIELDYQLLDQKKEVKRKKAETAAEKDRVKNKLIEYLENPDVEYAQPNYIYHSSAWTVTPSTAKPGDYNDAHHWYYNLGKLPELWQLQGCGAGADCGGDSTIIVAVIDSGVAFEAYDDSGPDSYYDWIGLSGGKNFTGVSTDHSGGSFNLYINPGEIASNGMDDECNGIIDDYNGVDMYAWYDIDYYLLPSCVGGVPQDFNDPEDLLYRKAGHPTDSLGHGTFVTGLIAGVVDNELSATGTVSPAFKVSIMPIAANIPFSNSFYETDIANGIYYAVLYGADVINLSLGGSSNDPFIEDAVNYAYDNGVTVVAASGNDGLDAINYPAQLDKVIAVGAANADNSRSYYSNYGTTLDIVAYVGQGASAGTATYQKSWSCFGGCNFTSTFSTIQEKYGIGTSFATPQVSAAVALLLSYNPALTESQIRQYLYYGAQDLGSPGFDNNFGWGALDFANSVTDLINNVNFESRMTELYRFWSDQNQGHFYTKDVAERDYVINNYDDFVWRYEGTAFKVDTCSSPEALSVYRFWSDKNQHHFYTINPTERDIVINNYDDFVWRYEGPAFCAFTYQAPITKPVYRFWSDQNQAHFYTMSETEKNEVINNYDDFVWRYEGIAYYADPLSF